MGIAAHAWSYIPHFDKMRDFNRWRPRQTGWDQYPGLQQMFAKTWNFRLEKRLKRLQSVSGQFR
jgi:hypothetical protein